MSHCALAKTPLHCSIKSYVNCNELIVINSDQGCIGCILARIFPLKILGHELKFKKHFSNFSFITLITFRKILSFKLYTLKSIWDINTLSMSIVLHKNGQFFISLYPTASRNCTGVLSTPVHTNTCTQCTYCTCTHRLNKGKRPHTG